MPLSLGTWATLFHVVVDRSVLCCNTNPVDGEGQEMVTLAPDRVMVRTGDTGAMRLQKPPISLPPARMPASGWPIVPLRVKVPPLPFVPPPSMVYQSIVNWARAVRLT